MIASNDLPSGLDDEPQPLPNPAVVAAVVFIDERSLAVSVESVRRQVYEVSRVVVIGGGPAAPEIAGKLEVGYAARFAEFVGALGPEADYVWVVHGDARPRPDALGALVAEAERNEAALVGSKILDASVPDRLESVGGATDVFGEVYTGLDPEEVDLEQYDVVRDVAFVSAVSMLVRRDLLKGLGGIDPVLPPVASGLDFSQRVRIAGGRVVVAPSSEVLHLASCEQVSSGWKEQAGRMRAMMKAYRWITLVWAIPAGWLLGLVDGLLRLTLGSTEPLRSLFRASAWNLLMLPSTLKARNALRAIRVAGDEELFRHQVSGSVRVRALGADLASRFGWIIDQEPGVVTEEEMQQEASIGGPAGLAVAIIVVGLATRSVWLGRPAGAGFWLPLGNDAGSVIGSYAGGWNPAGLGSAETLHPSAAMASLVQWLLGGWTGALGLITAIAVAGGVWGCARLLGGLGLSGAAKWLGGMVYVIGPFAMLFTNAAYWPGFVALGALPWLLAAVLKPVEGHGRLLWGKFGMIVVGAGLSGAFAPMAVAIPLVAVALAMPIIGKAGIRAASLWWALVAAVAGADLVAPYLLGVGPSAVTSDVFAADLWPSTILGVALLAAALFTVVFASGARSRIAGWGGSMIGAAVLLGALPFVSGEVRVATVTMAALGSAFVVGAGLGIDSGASVPAVTAQTIGALASIVVLVSVLPLTIDGRAGMPTEGWSDRLTFVDELQSEVGADRVLLIGPPDGLPGEQFVGDGYSYRLISGGEPTLDQAWLAAPRAGDRALESALDELNRGAGARPGELLAEFAVRWVVVAEGLPVFDVFRSQVDLAERQRLVGWSVYENLAARPRLEEPTGLWSVTRTGAEGLASESRVRLADNADSGWSPGWTQSDWANDLSSENGAIRYVPDALRRWSAVANMAILVAAAAVAFWGRQRS